MLFLTICRVEIFPGRLLWPRFRCRAGRLVVVIPRRVMICAPFVVLAGRLFLMRFLSHRYQLSYGSGYRKNLLFPARNPGTIRVNLPERYPASISVRSWWGFVTRWNTVSHPGSRSAGHPVPRQPSSGSGRQQSSAGYFRTPPQGGPRQSPRPRTGKGAFSRKCLQ
jgi:hypothetical protein